MAIVTSWHSAKKECEVYHNNSACTEENNIEPYNVREGTGGKRLCQHCARLNRQQSFNGLGVVGGLQGVFSNGLLATKKA